MRAGRGWAVLIKIDRRQFLSAAAAAATVAAPARAQRRLVLTDASRLNVVPVFSHWVARSEPEADFIARLRSELKEAASQKRPVSVGAARHSMGGQSLPRNGAAMTFNIDRCELDRANSSYRVHAGTRWFQVIKQLDPAGFSPAVMQSNSDFGVASTFSVNAHGWPTPYGPFGSTVRSLRMMLADGSIVTCSRSENAELFGLAMGGYGLFGVILDLEVSMVENRLMRPTRTLMPPTDFAARFIAAANDPAVRMIYGRLNVDRAAFFTQAQLVTYRPDPTPSSGLRPVARSPSTMAVAREIYRGQIGSEARKRARWFAETVAGPSAWSGIATRNNLMFGPVSDLEGRERDRTDILHEYFVAPDRFNDFVKGCRDIIPKAKAEFLNVTLRHVLKDETSVLAYAKTDRIAAVMSFSQEMTIQGETDMLRLTEAMIDMVGALGGSFYLPYRLHARPDQVAGIYPNTDRFIAAKRNYDPGLLFRNMMWDAYFAG
jgi:FAD/FMN-containing dehydrogenase